MSLFFAINSFKNLDLSNYDVVISSSASVAKFVNVKNGKHFSYCYYPTRAIWELNKYFGKSYIKYALQPIIPYLKYLDKKAANKVDNFIAISDNTKKSIKKYYDRDSDIIYCPIDTNNFYSSENRSNHYLIVSRLEEWKKIDHAIEAFNQLGYDLKIIGTGNEINRLKKMSNSNIEFLGVLNERELQYQYSIAKAVIFTPELEYGLIPLEAVASGTPVIAFGFGGINETMIPYNINKKFYTSIFYYEHNPKSLIKAVTDFQKIKFNSNQLIKYSERWDVKSFKSNFRKYISCKI